MSKDADKELSEDIEYLKQQYRKGMEAIEASGVDEITCLKLRVQWLEDNFFEMIRMIHE